jgi:hypothetical protein
MKRKTKHTPSLICCGEVKLTPVDGIMVRRLEMETWWTKEAALELLIGNDGKCIVPKSLLKRGVFSEKQILEYIEREAE